MKNYSRYPKCNFEYPKYIVTDKNVIKYPQFVL